MARALRSSHCCRSTLRIFCFLSVFSLADLHLELYKNSLSEPYSARFLRRTDELRREQMNKGLRVVLLGPTGIDKHELADRLKVWCQQNLGRSFTIVDFEKEYLTNSSKGGEPLSVFLARSMKEQQEKWKRAWDILVKEGLTNDNPEDRILVVHGTIVRGNYGVRCPCDLQRLAGFNADVVITLIDDVYNLWWRTEARAYQEYSRGRPTLEQLIMTRRTEQLLGDMIAFHREYPARHLVLPVAHPTSTLGRYIYTCTRAVYLSFPISRPREMLEKENSKDGIDAVNNFLKFMYNHEHECPGMAFINPLGIDELPLLRCLPKQPLTICQDPEAKEIKPVEFDLGSRWPIEAFWNPNECLSCSPPPEKRRPFDVKQLSDASGLILTDVSWRDFRFVMQARALVAFNPVMRRDRLSRGVEAEILAAVTDMKRVYIYQDQKLDPDNKLAEWIGTPGTMSADIRHQWIKVVESLDEIIERLKSLKE